MGLLAEQIVIDCAAWTLEDLFGNQPADWLPPLLRLAGDEGETAGLVLLAQPPAAARPQSLLPRAHLVEVGAPRRRAGGFQLRLRWETAGYRALFATFEGLLVVRPLDGQAVVSIEGPFSAEAGVAPNGRGEIAARRAADSAVRGLLGHLRSAVEASVLAR